MTGAPVLRPMPMHARRPGANLWFVRSIEALTLDAGECAQGPGREGRDDGAGPRGYGKNPRARAFSSRARAPTVLPSLTARRAASIDE